MILSHKFKFIFIKTRKVAGTSFEIAVSRHLGSKDVITPMRRGNETLRRSVSSVAKQNFRKSPFDFRANDYLDVASNAVRLLLPGRRPEQTWPRRFEGHMPAKLVRERIPDAIWESYFKFSIERNPWDKAVSVYCQNVPRRDISFRDFVLSGGAYWASNYDLYCIEGVPALDEIIRYESLAEGIAMLSERIGLPEDIYDLMHKIRANSQYRDAQGYRSMYDDETRRVIAIQFAREIELFGYEF